MAHGQVVGLAGVASLLGILFHLLLQIFVCFGLEEGVHGLECGWPRASGEKIIFEEVLLVGGWLVGMLVLLHFLQARCLLLPLGRHRLGTQPCLHIYHCLAALSAADGNSWRRRARHVQRCLVGAAHDSWRLSNLHRTLPNGRASTRSAIDSFASDLVVAVLFPQLQLLRELL